MLLQLYLVHISALMGLFYTKIWLMHLEILTPLYSH